MFQNNIERNLTFVNVYVPIIRIGVLLVTCESGISRNWYLHLYAVTRLSKMEINQNSMESSKGTISIFHHCLKKVVVVDDLKKTIIMVY